MLPRKTELAIGQLYRRITHINRFQRGLKQPRQAQEQKLLQIIRANANTVFGRRYNFDKIASVADYQRFVPPTTYEELMPYIEPMLNGANGQLTVEPAILFATTSGTTGKPKYVPITESHLQDYAHAFQVHNSQMITDHPGSAMGRFLIFASNDEEGITPGGTMYGAVSGLLRRRQSQLIQKYFSLPQIVGKIKDVESKYYTMLRLSLCQNITSVLGCNPSSFLLLADQMHEHAEELIADIFDGSLRRRYSPAPVIMESLKPLLPPNRERALELERLIKQDGRLSPKNVWPQLALLSCWKGGPLSFYLDKLPEHYGDRPVRDFGYMASEGRGSIPLNDVGAGGAVAVTCHFFEFVPEEDMDKTQRRYLTVDQLELGDRYYIFFTTGAGLYRYNIHDLVEVVGFEQNTPVIQFVQKGLGISSVTGEKLTEEQVQVALRYAVRQLNLTELDHFTFAAELGYPPHYVCYMELNQQLPESVSAEFLRVFEQSLQLQNIEYKDKRATRRLGAPTMQVVPQGTFTKLRQQRVAQGAPEAQVKIPLLNSSQSFTQTLAYLSSQ
ncbi:MAG TPA: GH3 auxin-responsive promoter family protein [Candidatus Obscuribacterales bacterium]